MNKTCNKTERQICIIVDTNIWYSSELLKSQEGASLVYALARQGGVIGLPEVVELELQQQVEEMGDKASKDYLRGGRTLTNLIGSSVIPIVPTPTKDDLKKALDARLTELSPVLVHVPLCIESVKDALKMVNANLPPNGPKNNQQFKDSVIWQDTLRLSEDYIVHLLTRDSGFFENRDLSKGLAPNLSNDCHDTTIQVWSDLAQCLAAIRTDIPTFNKERLVSKLVDLITPKLHAEANEHHLVIDSIQRNELIVYRQPNKDCVAVDYSIFYDFHLDKAVHESYARVECVATVSGSCRHIPGTETVYDNFINDIIFEWKYMNMEDGHASGHGLRARSFPGDPSILFRRSM